VALRQAGVAAGRSPVYRTLPLLVECGLVRELSYEDPVQYEFIGGTPHHEHLRCTACGRVIEFTDPGLERSLNRVFHRFGFASSSHLVEAEGLCRECRAAGKGEGGAEPPTVGREEQ